jgi:hypothetical protein
MPRSFATIHSRPRSFQLRSAALSAVAVVIGSLLIGGLTSPAQQHLPFELRSLANSAGGWSMFAFLLVWLSHARPVPGAVLGAVSFVLMVESYGIVSFWRGFSPLVPFSTSWTVIALVAGPIIGGAAALVRYASRGWMLASVSVLSLVLIAEGVYGLTIVGETTSPVYWVLELIAGIAFVVAAAIKYRRRRA